MSYDLRKCTSKLNAIFALVLAACSVAFGQHVTTSRKPGTDFSKYHTYIWVTIQDRQHPDQAVDAQIKQSIDSQLKTKGFTKTDDSADLNVAYQVAVTREEQWSGWIGLMDTSQTMMPITVGTLVLDMYDPASKQLIWTGRATKTVEPNNSRETKQKNLEKAIQKLLKGFPPK